MGSPTFWFVTTVPLKYIEYGVYGDLTIIYPKAIFYLLKGDCRLKVGYTVRAPEAWVQDWGLGLGFRV